MRLDSVTYCLVVCMSGLGAAVEGEHQGTGYTSLISSQSSSMGGLGK